MIGVGSPFIEDIPKCKVSMRKLRKKIYKYTSAQVKPKKCRDCTQDIFNILQLRAIPNFVLESLRKKRSLDLSSLKNLAISPGSTFPEMSTMVRSQQDEIQQLFREHRLRMKHARKPAPKLEHRFTSCSSTDQSIKIEQYSAELSQSQDICEFESHPNSECPEIDHGMMMEAHADQVDYLALESSLFSQEELFKF